MDIVYYEFDGSDGCELCQAYSSDLYTSVPARPHENCDCDINSTEMVFDPDEEDPDVEVKSTTSHSYTTSEEFHVGDYVSVLEEEEIEVVHSTTIYYEEHVGPEIEENAYLSEAQSLVVDIDERRTVSPGIHSLYYRVNYRTTAYTVVYSYTYKDNDVYEEIFEGHTVTPVSWEVIWDDF